MGSYKWGYKFRGRLAYSREVQGSLRPWRFIHVFKGSLKVKDRIRSGFRVPAGFGPYSQLRMGFRV